MKKKELTAVERVLRSVYQSHHFCALHGKAAKENGVKDGTMCDDCEDYIKDHLKYIKTFST
jgi:hypothetical protein